MRKYFMILKSLLSIFALSTLISCINMSTLESIHETTPKPKIMFTRTPTVEPMLPPPAGLIYGTSSGRFIVTDKGTEKYLLPANRNDFVDICTEGTKILHGVFARENDIWIHNYSLFDISLGKSTSVDAGEGYDFCYIQWWPNSCKISLAIVQPKKLSGGRWCSGLPGIFDVRDNSLSLLGEVPSESSLESSISPDGNAVAFVQDGRPWMYRKDTGSKQLDLQIIGFESNNPFFDRPVWSPDSSQLAFLVAIESLSKRQEGIAILNLQKGTTRFVQNEFAWEGEMPAYLSWSPDGKYLSLAQPENIICLLNVTSNNIECREVVFRDAPKWSPNSLWIAYSSYDRESGEYSSFVSSIDGVEVHKLGQASAILWSPNGQNVIFGNSQYQLFEGKDTTTWMTQINNWIPHKVDLPSDAFIDMWVNSDYTIY
jgi:Tol biopolymer transport system component